MKRSWWLSVCFVLIVEVGLGLITQLNTLLFFRWQDQLCYGQLDLGLAKVFSFFFLCSFLDHCKRGRITTRLLVNARSTAIMFRWSLNTHCLAAIKPSLAQACSFVPFLSFYFSITMFLFSKAPSIFLVIVPDLPFSSVSLSRALRLK